MRLVARYCLYFMILTFKPVAMGTGTHSRYQKRLKQADTAAPVKDRFENVFPIPGIQPRIVGGRSAEYGEAAYQMRIEINNDIICGGSLLNHKGLLFVLTAAHCLWKGPELDGVRDTKELQVVGADLNFNTFNPREKWFNVQKIIMHPDYDPRVLLNDIGILFLDKYVVEDRELHHIRLPGFNWEDPELCTITGWGAMSWGLAGIPDLQIADVPVVPWHECRQLRHIYQGGWTTFLGPKEFCLGNHMPFSKLGVCEGDSGGPAVAYNWTEQRWYLAGLVSYSVNKICGDSTSASVFTRISNYVDWITGTAQGWLDVHGTGNPNGTR